LTSTGGVSAREHEINMTTDSTASAALPFLQEFVFDIGRPS